MRLKPRFALPFMVAAVACLSVSGRAQSAVQEERVAASFVIALGRTPTAVEIERWARQDPLPVAALVARHRQFLQGDSAAAHAVFVKASLDAFGRAPSSDQAEGRSGGGTYAEQMQCHIRWLADHPAEYEQVLHRAYRLVLQRDAYSPEMDYWKRQPSLSFALLVGCIEDWARRNRPGLTVTTGVATVSVNSAYLATVRLSSAVAAEARVAAGLEPAADAEMAFALGRNLVAPGAEQVASTGGIHFAAAGAANLASALGKE